MNLLLVAIASMMGWVAGVLIFISIPWMAPSSLRLQQFFHWLSMKSFKRALTVIEGHTNATITASSFYSAVPSERFKYDGEYFDFDNTAKRMRYCYNQPLGVVMIGKDLPAAVVDPVIAALGSTFDTMVERGRDVVYDAESGEKLGRIDQVELPLPPKIVDITEAESLLSNSAPPKRVRETEEWRQHSLAEFGKHHAIEIFTWLGLFVGTLGVIWLAFGFADQGGAGGGGQVIPIGAILPVLPL